MREKKVIFGTLDFLPSTPRHSTITYTRFYLKVYMQGKMKNFKFRNLERNDLP